MEFQEKPKTEMVDIHELLKAEGIRTDEQTPQEEIKPEDVLEKITKDLPKEEEPVIEAPVVEPKVEAPKTTTKSDYTKKLLDVIELGFIENAQITWGEGEHAKEVYLSDLTDLDKDQFDAIISKYKEAKDNELKEKYISTDGLDERTKKYNKKKKAGGDISQLIEQEVQYVNPLAQFDLDNEAHQEALIRQVLQGQGYKPRYIDQEIEEMREGLSLDSEAQKIAQQLNKNFDDFVETKKQEQLAKIEEDKIQQKEFRKNISQELKSLVPNDNVAKLILDNATKRDEVGLTNTDKLYFEAQKDPKLFAEVSFFLNNREEFYKSIGAKDKNKEALKTVKTLFTINPQVVKTEKQENKPDTEGDKILEKLTKQFNQ